MALRTEIIISVLLAIVISCNVEAREGGFFQPPVKENAAYLDPKEYYPTGRENSYNNYYQSGNANGYGNGAGEGAGYKETVNGYGRGAEYTTENGGGEGYSGESFGNGGGYGSGERYVTNGRVEGYSRGNGNGNSYGNGNGQYIPNNGYNQENP